MNVNKYGKKFQLFQRAPKAHRMAVGKELAGWMQSANDAAGIASVVEYDDRHFRFNEMIVRENGNVAVRTYKL